MLGKETVMRGQSGVELLKVIAMFMIILSHSVQSLETAHIVFWDLNISTHDPQRLCLIFLRGFGTLGNLMFLIPSAWFLSDRKSIRLNKISEMVADVFIISVIGLIIYIAAGGAGTLSAEEIIQSFFPTVSANNWYITCYLLLYAIVPLLNLVIERIDQKTHLTYSMAFFVLYSLIRFVKESFFYNDLIGFVGIYFVVAYCKKYMPKVCSSPKKNLLLLCVSAVGWVVFTLTVNFLGNHSDVLHEKMLYWIMLTNPFFIVFAFALFNLLRGSHVQSKAINCLSSFSMLIYIIHENYLFRSKVRPLYYDFVYAEFSYEYLIGWVLLYAVLLFLGAILLAALYRALLQPTIHKLAERCLTLLMKAYGKIEAFVMKLQ